MDKYLYKSVQLVRVFGQFLKLLYLFYFMTESLRLGFVLSPVSNTLKRCLIFFQNVTCHVPSTCFMSKIDPPKN